MWHSLQQFAFSEKLRPALLVMCLAALAALAWLLLERRRTRARLQLVLDCMKEGVVVLDARGKVLLMNTVASRLLNVPWKGADYNEVLANFDAFSPEQGTPIKAGDWPSQRALRGEFVQNFRIAYRHKRTGEIGSREMSSARVPVETGFRDAVIISYRDDTPRFLVDLARSQLAAIVEFSQDAIIAKDTRGIITSWNYSAEKMFGYTAAEALGMPVRMLIPPDLQGEEDDILRLVLGKEVVEPFDTTRLTKDGRSIDVSITISPILDNGGNVIGASKIARDITSTRQLERRLHQAEKMDAMGRLTGGIAHDFNNLLAIVVGNLDLADSLREASADVSQPLQVARKAALRAADLTRRLLAFSSNGVSTEQVPTSLETCIANAVQLSRHAMGPNVEIRTELQAGLQPVCLDASAFDTALLNLLLNARDAMPDGGVITVAAKPLWIRPGEDPRAFRELAPGAWALLTVTDTGVGISSQAAEHAFEPFFTTKPRGHGTGLGLSMVYGFAQQCHGVARIEAAPEGGTVVSLLLPCTAAAAVENENAQRCASRSTESVVVLLVDDEPDLLHLASLYLTRMGMKTLQAEDAAEALRVLCEHPEVDVMVTDILMPGGTNGAELAEIARSMRPDLYIVYTSGFPADALARQQLATPRGPLLHKPYRLTELEGVIREVCQAVPA